MKEKNQTSKALLPPGPHDLAGLAEVAEGSVVSRTLGETPGGTLTLFAFAAGQGLSEHSAPFDALVVVLEGTGEFTVGGERHAVRAGQILRMPAHVPHAVRAVRAFKMLLIMLRGGRPLDRAASH